MSERPEILDFVVGYLDEAIVDLRAEDGPDRGEVADALVHLIEMLAVDTPRRIVCDGARPCHAARVAREDGDG